MGFGKVLKRQVTTVDFDSRFGRATDLISRGFEAAVRSLLNDLERRGVAPVEENLRKKADALRERIATTTDEALRCALMAELGQIEMQRAVMTHKAEA
jgi:hypothetical protein